MMKGTSHMQMWMTQCGLRSLYQITRIMYVIHEIPRQGIPPLHPNQEVPGAPPPQPNHRVPATPSLQPDKREMPLDHKLMELNIPEDILNLINVPEEVKSDFGAWAQSMLDYPW